MKFNCDAWADRRKARRVANRISREAWHDWFAWRPVKLAHGDCRWLEVVERRFVMHRVHPMIMLPDYYTRSYRSK